MHIQSDFWFIGRGPVSHRKTSAPILSDSTFQEDINREKLVEPVLVQPVAVQSEASAQPIRNSTEISARQEKNTALLFNFNACIYLLSADQTLEHLKGGHPLSFILINASIPNDIAKARVIKKMFTLVSPYYTLLSYVACSVCSEQSI